MGNILLGAEYMPKIKERARRMKAAIREEKKLIAIQQKRLPGF